ncbi:uncharacterized protein LOC108667236 isoform X2 [Hyalella azteca]|uniref:Uncharacterized protein LOC108667236 isoform X2 n=1 Tax=Hyalella azteca TaxID=294128 RepID=A0A8B7N7A4_HYAAZ|nr:uncharacterized protein LOC108667236 isoform X2 [Hyalella azteca]
MKITATVVQNILLLAGPSDACRASNKAVGVCLHIFLERDFMPLKGIVYPYSAPNLHSMSYRYDTSVSEFSRGWVEGPALEHSCKRLRDVTDCCTEILLDCDSASDFFKFRHLLSALEKVHDFLCGNPESRKYRFVEFLQTIECAEKARVETYPNTCHRHNVTANVWNKIFRLEIGSEICDSLTTQRACLLENGDLLHYCRKETKVDIYTQVSGLFLWHWCGTPLLPGANNLPHDRLPGSATWTSAATAPTSAAVTLVISCTLIAYAYIYD